MRTYIRIVHQELFFYGTRIGCGVSGFFGLKNPDVAGATLSWLIGLGIISTGISYLVALCGINRVELLGSCYTDKQGI